MTEPDAGSDLGRISTSARAQGQHWRLSGRKQFITNGCGDVCIVLARSEQGSAGLDGLSLFVAPRLEHGRDNYRVARPESKSVIRGSATCELSFEDSCAELLGPPGAGFREILTFMNEARLAVAIQALGIATAALRAAQSYAGQRVQMGRAIARHELVADLLLDMEAETAALARWSTEARAFDRIRARARARAREQGPAAARLRDAAAREVVRSGARARVTRAACRSTAATVW